MQPWEEQENNQDNNSSDTSNKLVKFICIAGIALWSILVGLGLIIYYGYTGSWYFSYWLLFWSILQITFFTYLLRYVLYDIYS